MSFGRCDRGSVVPRVRDLATDGVDLVVRRRISFPRPLVARSRRALPRARRTTGKTPPSFKVRVTGQHDFGDGRYVVEFDGPALDLMLYHDEGVTLAEWLTIEGGLIALVPVGDC
jgi:hypothetical protein